MCDEAVRKIRFANRHHAGRVLAERLQAYAGRDDVLVLGLPGGNVPVAYEVARSLGAALDVFVVRKLGVPQQPELAMGAIASGGVRVLEAPRLERAIGVIYRPDTERASHYFTARLPQQFDVVIHIDTTRAVEPLEKWSRHEVDLPETYPTGV